MTKSVVFFSKHDILNAFAVHWVMYIAPKMYHIKEVLYPDQPFGVA